MSAPFELSQALALDNSGNPLPGATLDFYVTGTTTRLDTFTNFGLTTPNTNPVVADANGRFGAIYVQPRLYKVVLKTAAGVEVWTKDPNTEHESVYETALPGSAYPGLVVCNTTDGNRYRRNATNSAWGNEGAFDTVANTASVTEQLAGTSASKYSTPDSVAGLWEKGTNVASATTLTLPSSGGGYFVVTGNTTIAAINAATDGRRVLLYFASNPTLTHGSGLTIPGSASIQMQAGSVAEFTRDGSAWLLTSHGPASLRFRKRSQQVFTASGTWTRPEGVVAAYARVQAAGAGGSASATASASNGSAGSGGGGGGYSEAWITSGLGATETVTVGTGGAGGGSSAAAGASGGNSSFGAHCTANGGANGTAGMANGATTPTTTSRGAGGAAGTGNIMAVPGQDGQRANRTSGFNVWGGDGGGSFLGQGGRGGIDGASQDAGQAGVNYGGGGGGGAAADIVAFAAGGNGAGGIVIVEEWVIC